MSSNLYNIYSDCLLFYESSELYKRNLALNIMESVIPVDKSCSYYSLGLRGIERCSYIYNDSYTGNSEKITYFNIYVDVSYFLSYSFRGKGDLGIIHVISNDCNLCNKSIDYFNLIRFHIDMSNFTCVVDSRLGSLRNRLPKSKEEYLNLLDCGITITCKQDYPLSLNLNHFSSLSDELRLLKFILSFHPCSLSIYHNFSDKSLSYFLYYIFSCLAVRPISICFVKNPTYLLVDDLGDIGKDLVALGDDLGVLGEDFGALGEDFGKFENNLGKLEAFEVSEFMSNIDTVVVKGDLDSSKWKICFS